MDKVTVIGFKASGKTCYLAGMYDIMSNGIENFSLVEKNPDQDWYLQGLWEQISDGENRSWPVPNDDKRVYSFSLCHSFDKIIEFEWLDYPGAALVDPGYGLIDEIKNQLSDSSCLLVLVNGESFAFDGKPADQKRILVKSLDTYLGEYRRKDEYRDMNPDELLAVCEKKRLEDYKRIVAKNLKRNKDLEAVRQLTKIGSEDVVLPPIGIVVTKCDLIEDEWVDYVQEILRENFKSIFAEGGEDDRIVMMAAVTLGNDIQFGGDADPVDIELPIAFAVLSILRKYVIAARVLKKKTDTDLSEHEKSIFRVFKPGQAKKLREEIAKMDKIIAKLSRDAIRLLDLFEESKPIYINGEKQNFKKYFREDFNT